MRLAGSYRPELEVVHHRRTSLAPAVQAYVNACQGAEVSSNESLEACCPDLQICQMHMHDKLIMPG